jgi:hypothetical protein
MLMLASLREDAAKLEAKMKDETWKKFAGARGVSWS